jgi:hypothetical protein
VLVTTATAKINSAITYGVCDFVVGVESMSEYLGAIESGRNSVTATLPPPPNFLAGSCLPKCCFAGLSVSDDGEGAAGLQLREGLQPPRSIS